MPDPKHAPPRPQQGKTPETVASYIREHDAHDVAVPAHAAHGVALEPMRTAPDEFLEDWALRHFTISVQMHDVTRVSEGDDERRAVLEDLELVQGILLELHDFTRNEPRLRAMMDTGQLLQNGVSALYTWLSEVLDAATRLRVTHARPGFTDLPGDEVLRAILRTLERVHPDLETLVRVDALDVDEDVARKIALCFRQIGAVVVRVAGRPMSTHPPA